jgi:NitT/TauT family transport system permease protein
MSVARRALGVVAPPLLFGAAFLALWEWFVSWRNVRPFVLVKPSQVWSSLADNVGPIWDAAVVTGTNALVGLLLGTLFGTLMALVASGARALGEMINPLATAVNAVPIVVVVAVLTRMYPADSEIPRRLMVLLVVFFVVFVNVLRGLRESQPTQLELMSSYAATRTQQFRKVRLPNAMPYLFTGIRVAAPLAVITAVVAEYFGGRKNGLGSSITSFLSTAKKDIGFAYVVGAASLGIVFFVAATILEFVAVPWQRQRSSSR